MSYKFSCGPNSYPEKQSCILGLFTFKMLGGRFWAVSPSSYTHVGSFARKSIPGKETYANQLERDLLSRIGSVWGCHTCGARILSRSNLVADHQPPKAVGQKMNKLLWRRLLGVKVNYRFYPHCKTCSNIQGSILSSASRKSYNWWNIAKLNGSGGGRLAKSHAFKFRFNHLTGGIISAVTVLDAKEFNIAQGIIKRFEKLRHIMKSYQLELNE